MEKYASSRFAAGFTSGIEGPACDKEGNVYAVNYERNGTIGRIDPSGQGEIFIELPPGSEGCGIRFDTAGRMYVSDCKGHNIWRIEVHTRKLEIYAHEARMNQPNDIAITHDGIVFASDPNWAENNGQIWRIDLDGTVTLLEDGMGTTNGIEVSPDGTKLYVNETMQRNVWCYDLKEGLDPVNKRLFHQYDDFGTDGMRCDQEGNLFVARYWKGVVSVLSPRGRQLREIAVSGKLCTNLTFGGPDGRTCYVTVADHGVIDVFETE